MNKTIIIAEAGVNHNGNMHMARQLIDAAAEAGADYVKFQTFKAENLVSESAKQAAYQTKNMGKEISQLEMLKALEIPYEEHVSLKKYAEQKGIKFLSTGFDDESLDFLNELGIDFFKIPSGEAVNFLYLKKIASYRLPIVLSTGLCTMEEVEWSLNTLEQFGIDRKNITVLHCTTEYPAPFEGVNLKAMQTIGDLLGVKTGYSDHTKGIEISLAAVALGATIIEKHFTLDRNLPGPDHKASLEPNELKELVNGIRNIEKALGNGIKQRTETEATNLIPARKSLYYKNTLKAGTKININDLIAKRPGDGIPASNVEQVTGKELRVDVEQNQKVDVTHFN